MYTEFDSILTKLKSGQTWDFPGGVFPDQRKALSNQTPIRRLPLANHLYVPVKQHIGVEGQICVEVGQPVLKGQPLTRSMNPFAVPVHAPTSGTVKHIGPHVSAHPSGLPDITIEIEADHNDEWCELKPLTDYTKVPKVQLTETICGAGISGMGGAGFPTHLKATPKKDVEFLIINGVECEPYITSDDRLMREHAWQIRQGIDVLVHLLNPKQVIIAVEDNKPEAIEAMQVACQEAQNYLVCGVETKYPAGGEKQLIQVLTNREVPQQGLPIDVGVIMQNVGTCFAVADAVFSGKPLVERVVTLTGEALDAPGNVWAPLGTPVSHLLAQAAYHAKRQNQPKVIMGGPMMGFAVSDVQVPVVKISNCLLVPSAEEVVDDAEEQPCIRCSACADACPASLLPQQLYWHSKAQEYDKAQEYNLFDCIECGACAFVCPSDIPLVHYYRKAKSEIRFAEEEKDKADKARERFEARKARLERERLEREEKHRKAAEARKQAMAEKGSDAKDKIAAALARAKAKKDATDTDTAPEASAAQDKIAAAVARAKAKRAAQQQAGDVTQEATSQPVTDAKSDKVAAAIARAKAKKAAMQAEQSQSEQASGAPQVVEQDSKADKVATAVARAKAKQAEQAPQETAQSAPQANAGGSKEDRVAAAIAKAKAKREAKLAENSEAENGEATQVKPTESSPPTDKVSAAIAKAKAKQAARQAGESVEPASESSGTAASSESADDDKKARIAAAVAKAKARQAAKQQEK